MTTEYIKDVVTGNDCSLVVDDEIDDDIKKKNVVGTS